MEESRKSVVLLVIVAATVALAIAIVVPNWRFYRSADGIELYLLTETPLGAPEEEVLAHLRSKGLNPAPPWRGAIEPNTLYPPNTIAGHSFIRVLVREHSLPLTTSVEAFYIFGADRRLVEIAVRKTTDSL